MAVRRRGWNPAVLEREPIRLERPAHLTGFAAEHWDRVEPLLSEMSLLQPIDSEALTAMCQWWSEFRILQATPATTSAETYKRSIALASCFKNWSNLAARFGLTPKDREKLTIDPPRAEDPAAAFIA